MSIGRCARVIVLLSLVLFFPAILLGAEISITLKSTAEVVGNSVRLSDIAVINGPSESHCKLLGDIVVAQSPQPGQDRFVGADFIRIRLKQVGVDTNSILIKGNEDVSVSRKAEVLPSKQIKRVVETQIRNWMPWNNEDVIISNISFDETILLPKGNLSYRIVPKSNEDYLGRMRLALHLFVEGALVRKIHVNATISVVTDVVTVIRPLGKHQHVELADVALQRRDLAKLPSDAVRTIEDALGNRAKRKIYPNTVLQSSMIALPPLVRRGDMVKIVANSGLMTITATGRIKQQGCKGEMVRVVNTNSNRMITARVTGAGTVAVEF